MDKAFEQVRNDPQVQRSLAQHNVSFKDERIRATFAVAPALGGAFTDAGLAPIEIPVHIVGGRADTVAPVPTNARRFANTIEHAQLTILEDVGHYTFLAECTEIGKNELPFVCIDSEIDRSVVHQQVVVLHCNFSTERYEGVHSTITSNGT